jgi:acyl carrier protein
MKQHSHVREVEVVLRDPGEVNQRLVAYVALAEKAERRREQSLAEIRRFLIERLPNYMIPGVLTVLEELPRTTTGKVDAARLPPPEMLRQARESRLAVPRNPVEEAIAQLWQQILKLNQVGMDENFFELGGHSLAASWLVSQVRRLFGVELSLQSFFKKPTIAAMAGLILERSGATVVPAEATEVPAKKATEPQPATARSDSWEQILANLDVLSEADLNTLLGRLQAEPELDGAVVEVETKFGVSTNSNFDFGDAELALSSIDRMSDRDVDALLQTLTNVEPQIL